MGLSGAVGPQEGEGDGSSKLGRISAEEVVAGDAILGSAGVEQGVVDDREADLHQDQRHA